MSGAMQRITCLHWEDLYFGHPGHTSLLGSQTQGKSILKFMPLLSQIPITMQQQQQMLRARLMNRNKNSKEEDSTTKALVLASATIEPLDEESGEVMNVLVSGDDRGNIRLGLFGTFDLPVISVTELMRAVVPDFRTRESLAAMESEYKRVLRYSEDCIETIEQNLSDNGVTSTPALEFTRLLLTGIPSPSIDQYIQRELGHEGILQWDRGARSAFGTVRRVAFENLVPACERLLVHLTDILGYSQWKERYSALAIMEQDVYDCIKAVGDFMGIIEELFRCVKEQQTQFLEFKNWLDQVLDMMQNASRSGDDVTPEEQKHFPPVNTIKVVEYINSGLVSDPVQKCFRRTEDDPAPEQTAKQESAQSAPLYPVVYSFAAGLVRPQVKTQDPKYRVPDIESEGETSSKPRHTIPSKAQGAGLQRAKTMMLSKDPSPLSRSATKSFLKPSTSAASVSAASSSSSSLKRTMTTMPPPPAPRAPRATTAPTAQDTQPSVKLGNTPATAVITSTLPKPSLGEQLKIMTDRCTALFRVSEKAVVDSIKITQSTVIRDLGIDHLDGASKEPWECLKMATRYCDMGQEAWHYVAIYQEPTVSFPDGTLHILRKRRVPPMSTTFTCHDSLSAPTGVLSQGTASSKKHKLDRGTLKPLKRAMTSRSGIGGGSGDSGLAARTTTRSPLTPLTPKIEQLRLQSPTTSTPPSPLSSNLKPDKLPATLCSNDVPDVQILVYSLRDDEKHGTEYHPGQSSTPGSSKSSSSYFVRDVLFTDDHTLCLLLSSNRLQQQYVVSVPIPINDNSLHDLDDDQTTDGRRPRFSILDKSKLQATWQGTPLLDSILTSCLQGYPSSSSPPLPSMDRLGGALPVFPLPITRSRCVTHFGGGEVGASGAGLSQDAGGGGARGPSQATKQPHASLPDPILGPMALASNEREHRRVLSIHGAAENNVVSGGDGGISGVEGRSYPRATPASTIGRRIAVFELDGEYYHPA
ncbi:hypothetical protein BGZ73_008975 [Actinomortierella ambigua]|nr:hypothetical protein BGZ73_008975 [Actinomortierella ambigua]